MNFVQIIGKTIPTWDSNLLKSITLFNAYTDDTDIKCNIINDNIFITFSIGDNILNFILKIPFDYPNNFNYFTLVCTDEIEEGDTSVKEFITKFNDYFKFQDVNISLGYILKFISANKNIISPDLKVKVDTLSDSDEYIEMNAPLPDDLPSEIVTLEPTVPIASPKPDEISDSQENQRTETNFNLFKNNFHQFLNSQILIDPEYLHIYQLKNKKLDDINNIGSTFIKEKNRMPFNLFLNLELVFNEILSLYKKYEVIFLKDNLYNFTINHEGILLYVTLNIMYPCAEPEILLSSPVIKENPISFIKTQTQQCLGTYNLETVIDNCFTVFKKSTVKKDVLNYNLLLSKLVLYDIDDISLLNSDFKDIKLTNFKPHHLFSFNMDMSIYNNNRLENHQRIVVNNFIKKFKTNNLLKYTTSLDSIEFHKYISIKLETLKMHPYTKNKEFYHTLMNYVIINKEYFKNLNLNNIQIQYTSWCNLNRPRITLFETLLAIQ